MPTRVVTAAPRWAADDSTSARSARSSTPLTMDGRSPTGSSASSEREVSSRRRRLTASAVRWNWVSRGVASVSRDWADQAARRRSSSRGRPSWRGRRRRGGPAGSVPGNRTGRPRHRGRPTAVRPVATGGCGRRAAPRTCRAPAWWSAAHGQPGQLHLHLVSCGDAGRPRHRLGEPDALAVARGPGHGDQPRRRVVDAEQAHRGAARDAGHHRPDRVEEHRGVQLGRDRLGGDPRRTHPGDLLERAQHVGPLPALGVDAAVQPHHRRGLRGRPGGHRLQREAHRGGATASAYSGPAAAATDSMVSTPSIRVRVTTSCRSRRGAKRHTGGGRGAGPAGGRRSAPRLRA